MIHHHSAESYDHREEDINLDFQGKAQRQVEYSESKVAATICIAIGSLVVSGLFYFIYLILINSK